MLLPFSWGSQRNKTAPHFVCAAVRGLSGDKAKLSNNSNELLVFFGGGISLNQARFFNRSIGLFKKRQPGISY